MVRRFFIVGVILATLSNCILKACDPGERLRIREKYSCNTEKKAEARESFSTDEKVGQSLPAPKIYYGGWGYPKSVEVCNYDPDCMPWVSGNGKRLFFVSTNVIGPARPGHMGDWDIYMSEWDSINQCWGKEVNAGPNINTSFAERRPSSTYNGDTLYFGRGGIYMSTWDGTQWTPATQLPPPVNPNADNPAISFDGQRLYFDSNRPGGYGGSDIWVAKWNGTAWDSVTNIGPPVNTSNVETRCFESADGQRLYFSNFGGRSRLEGSYGGTDIYVSSWTGSGWGTVSVVAAPINNDRTACTPYESPDGNELWIASESWEGSRGDEDLWVARKGNLFSPDTAQGYGNWIKTGELENAIYVYDLKEGNGAIYAATACADTVPMGKVFKTINGGATWTATADLPGAMVVYSLIVCGDTIYAGTYPNGDVFKSVNGGSSWTNTANIPGITSSRALLRLQNGDILVGTAPESLIYSRVYRTTDGGLSWTRTGLLREIDPPFAFLYQATNGTIFAGGWSMGPLIYKSGNNGVTWDTLKLLSTNERASVDGF
ncbi:MAG: PD40 domain-containing protein, partial [Candidatus Stahlbacteria bacterium]|nr:PD40 domain-containing protein [Candidatus Stahlbacteria bacterium]